MMQVQIVKSKIHRVTVTESNLDYIGSITIDQDLMDAADILPGEGCLLLTITMESVLIHTLFQANAVPA